MDLRMFFQKIRQLEREIPAEHVVVVSHETPDGGREGAKTEVGRLLAARMIVEGRARLASEAETGEYHALQEARRLEASTRAIEQRLVVNLSPQPRRPRRPAKAKV